MIGKLGNMVKRITDGEAIIIAILLEILEKQREEEERRKEEENAKNIFRGMFK